MVCKAYLYKLVPNDHICYILPTKPYYFNYRYEKPTRARGRINYERTRAIYNEDMQNKIKFIMRKNRKEPYPGTV